MSISASWKINTKITTSDMMELICFFQYSQMFQENTENNFFFNLPWKWFFSVPLTKSLVTFESLYSRTFAQSMSPHLAERSSESFFDVLHSQTQQIFGSHNYQIHQSSKTGLMDWFHQIFCPFHLCLLSPVSVGWTVNHVDPGQTLEHVRTNQSVQ